MVVPLLHVTESHVLNEREGRFGRPQAQASEISTSQPATVAMAVNATATITQQKPYIQTKLPGGPFFEQLHSQLGVLHPIV